MISEDNSLKEMFKDVNLQFKYVGSGMGNDELGKGCVEYSYELGSVNTKYGPVTRVNQKVLPGVTHELKKKEDMHK